MRTRPTGMRKSKSKKAVGAAKTADATSIGRSVFVSYSKSDTFVLAKAQAALDRWYSPRDKGATPASETLSGALVVADKVAKGFPTKAVDDVIEAGLVEPDVVYALVVPRRTLADRKQKKKSLTPEQSDRLARMLRIYVRAEDAIGDMTRASRWLHKENRALAGRRPIDLLGSDAGARAVEKVLGRLEHGVIS